MPPGSSPPAPGIAPSPYADLHRAWLRLAQDPADAPTRLLLVSGLGRIGLFGPAIELLDEAPALRDSHPELRRLRQLFAQRPSGLVAWSQRAEMADANLQALRDRDPRAAAEVADRAGLVADLDLFRTSDGNWLLATRAAGLARRWLPAIADWNALAENLDIYPTDPNSITPPYLLDGIGLGRALRLVFDRTLRLLVGYTPRLHVVEPNLAQFAAWLHLADHRDLLRSDRVHLWLGPQAEQRLIDFYELHRSEERPRFSIATPRWGSARAAGEAKLIDRLAAGPAQRYAALRSTLLQSLAGRATPAYYAERFANRRRAPLRILGLTSRFTTFLQYSMRDMQQAAAALGHELRILMEPHNHTPTLSRDCILAEIQAFHPDLILLIDHNRSEYGDLYDLPIPFCNWIQDDLPNLFGPGRGRLHPFDIVVGLIGSLRARPSGYPRRQWRHLPLPVSTHVFHPAPLSAQEQQKYGCDVSFVTNLSVTADQWLAQNLARTRQPELRRLMQAQLDLYGPLIARGQAPASVPQTIGQTQQLARQLGFELDDTQANALRQHYTERLINIFFRQQVLEWSAELGLDLRIYGRGWEAHPTLARFARGPAEHGGELRAIYRASRINLQALPSGAVHQRLIEGLCSGGFFLIRRTRYDESGALASSIRAECVARGLTTEDQLWNIDQEPLASDVRRLNANLYAPQRLYDGFVADCGVASERGFPMEAGSLLPGYDRVAFGARADFEQRVAEFLGDPTARESIAQPQRTAVQDAFSYETNFERMLEFAAGYFAELAQSRSGGPSVPPVPGDPRGARVPPVPAHAHADPVRAAANNGGG